MCLSKIITIAIFSAERSFQSVLKLGAEFTVEHRANGAAVQFLIKTTRIKVLHRRAIHPPLQLPLSTFRRCVADHRGEHKVEDSSFLDHFFSMAFAQLTYCESLRDIDVNLRVQDRRLYHMGFRC